MEELWTNLNSMRVATFGLSEEHHDMVVKMLQEDRESKGGYRLTKPDREMVNVWIADAHSEGREDYAEFLRLALAEDADLYTLVDEGLIGCSQEIGEVAVYK